MTSSIRMIRLPLARLAALNASWQLSWRASRERPAWAARFREARSMLTSRGIPEQLLTQRARTQVCENARCRTASGEEGIGTTASQTVSGKRAGLSLKNDDNTEPSNVPRGSWSPYLNRFSSASTVPLYNQRERTESGKSGEIRQVIQFADFGPTSTAGSSQHVQRPVTAEVRSPGARKK